MESLSQMDENIPPFQPSQKKRKRKSISQVNSTPALVEKERDQPPMRQTRAIAATQVNFSQVQAQQQPPSVEDDYDDKFEAWQFEFTPSTDLIWRDDQALENIRSSLQAWFNQASEFDQEDDQEQTGHQVECHRVRNGRVSWHRYKQDFEELSRPRTAPFERYEADEDNGFEPPVGVVELPELPAINSRIAVKPVSTATMSLAPPLGMPFSTSSTTTPSLSVPYPRQTSHALYTTLAVPAGAFICPLYGEITSVPKYRSDPANQYHILGVPKPAVRGISAP